MKKGKIITRKRQSVKHKLLHFYLVKIYFLSAVCNKQKDTTFEIKEMTNQTIESCAFELILKTTRVGAGETGSMYVLS